MHLHSHGSSIPHAAHSHGNHTHAHSYNATFKIGIFLNAVYVLLEAIFGHLLHSSALVSDALHNLSDVMSMVLSWGAFAIARRTYSEHFTFGYGKATVLAAFINGVLLLVASFGIGYDIYSRWGTHVAIPGWEVSLISGIGILVNSFTAWLFFKSKNDLNMRGNYLHMAADALVSLGVLFSGLLIQFTGAFWVDTITSLVILLIVLYSTARLLKEASEQLMDKVPASIDLPRIKAFLREHPSIVHFHDLHVWSPAAGRVVLIAHILVKKSVSPTTVLDEIHGQLKENFGITDATLQVEEK